MAALSINKMSSIISIISFWLGIIAFFFNLPQIFPTNILFFVGEITLRLLRVFQRGLRVGREREFQFFALVVGLFYLQPCVRQNLK